jgi:ATP-binding cassette subfamily B multidrug efflux pump
MSSSKKPLLDFALLQRIIALASPYRLVFASSIAMSVLLAIISIGRPLLMIYAIDHYIAATFDLAGLKQMVVYMVVLLIAEALMRYSFNYITAWLGQSIVKDMRVRVYRHISAPPA